VHVAVLLAVFALFAAAAAVRSIAGAPRVVPEDQPRDENAIREPLQFLGPAAVSRVAELGPRISVATETAWRLSYRAPFEIAGCPEAAEWFLTDRGMRLERLLGDLRRGSNEEALAALVLLFETARNTRWAPGLLAHTENAEKLAALAEAWLRTWGPRAPQDAVLAEPALAALLAYGHWMQRASEPLPIGRRDETYEHACAFLATILRDESGRETSLGTALRDRHPAAHAAFESGHDVLAGLRAASEQLQPWLRGDCP
jgi:hypothetical protein